jgi:energy-coupling factor transporter ATP-binding protein EcfA2
MNSPIAPTIQIRDLHYAYPPPVHGGAPVKVLRGVNLELNRGEFVAVLGRVGAGKSTLCMALNGLVPHATGGIFRGDVTILGRNTKQHPVTDLARSVGLVFQDPEMQLTQMRVEDEVAFGPENLGVPTEAIEERVTWALEAVGLAGYRDRSPLLLSGGEKQRVAIAAMLAMRPQVLVLDEPTANLDPAGKASVFNLLAHLARERQITIVLATQELERVGRYAQRVVALHDGVIVADDTPAAVFARPSLLQAWGIGVPQLAALAHLLTQQTGRPYRFLRMGEAYAQLRAAHPGVPATAGPSDGRPLPVSTPAERAAQLPASGFQPSTSPAQFVLEQVSFSYPDGTPALRDVSLAIAPGEFVALLGANGSGKTTLAKHLNGLLKPTRGCVRVNGRDTRPARVAELARTVGYVFQNPDHQIFAATVEDELAFGPRLQTLSPADVTARVNGALATFGLASCRETPPALLGWGQRRQVALAAVLATRPQALVLDEPTGGLDTRSRDELMAAVKSFNRSGGTVILITHNMGLVAEYAARAVVMAAGRVAFDGTPRDLFARREILARVRLAVPAVVRLGQRLAPIGLEAGVLSCAAFAAAWQRLLAGSESEQRHSAAADGADSTAPGAPGQPEIPDGR